MGPYNSFQVKHPLCACEGILSVFLNLCHPPSQCFWLNFLGRSFELGWEKNRLFSDITAWGSSRHSRRWLPQADDGSHRAQDGSHQADDGSHRANNGSHQAEDSSLYHRQLSCVLPQMIVMPTISTPSNFQGWSWPPGQSLHVRPSHPGDLGWLPPTQLWIFALLHLQGCPRWSPPSSHHQARPLRSTFPSKHAPRVVQPSHANSLAHTSTLTYAKTLAQTDSLRGFPLGGLTMPSFMPNHWPMGFPPQEVFPFYFLLFPTFLLNIIFHI